MRNTLLKLRIKAQLASDALKDARGQDLVEYAFVVTLIASAAMAGMITIASDISAVFNTVGLALRTAG